MSRSHRCRLIVGLAAALLLSVPASPLAATPGALQVGQGGGPPFPARSLVLAVPGGHDVSGAQVHVTENGAPVGGASVARISAAGIGEFGVMLAVDTSQSMQGNSLRNAMIAARALAAARGPQQFFGMVTFNQTARLVLAPTTDAAQIHRALAVTPRAGGGTHIFDAGRLALTELLTRHPTIGALIVLSDGGDHGSITPEPSLAAAARAAHVAVYTVGIRNPTFEPASLSALARDGQGQFVTANPSELRGIFASLEGRLTSRYVIHYRSLAAYGRTVAVRVTVDGVPGIAATGYQSPAPPPATFGGRPPPKTFWTSTAAVIAAAGGAALLIGIAMAFVLLPSLRRNVLRRRVGQFTAQAIPDTLDLERSSLPSPLRALDRLLERYRWWPRFREDVEIAGFERSAIQILAISVGATVTVAVLAGLLFSTPVVSILLLTVGPFVMRSQVARRLKKQRSLFADQLPTHLQEMSSAMRAGHSLVSALASSTEAAAEPTRREFSRVVADEQLGKPLDEALQPLARRMGSPDIEQVALVAALHHQTGGNMAEVLERVADGVRERAELRRELEALTAQARLSRYVVTALPPTVLVLVELINPTYIRPLFTTGTGIAMLGLGTAMLLAGSFVMRAIVDIEV